MVEIEDLIEPSLKQIPPHGVGVNFGLPAC